MADPTDDLDPFPNGAVDPDDGETHRGAFGEFGGEATGLIDRAFRERIVLVGVTLKRADPEATDASMDELARLVDTAGADPVAFGIAAVAATRGRNLRSFSIRKESKDHGVEGRLAGALQPGDRVVVCEDTVTRGTSALEAASVIRELGADPVVILPVVDRGGTCAAAATEAGIAFVPLVTAPDLGFPYEGP